MGTPKDVTVARSGHRPRRTWAATSALLFAGLAVACSNLHGHMSPNLYLAMLRNPPAGQPGPEAISTIMKTWGVCLIDAGVHFQAANGHAGVGPGRTIIIVFGSGEAFRVTNVGTPQAAASPDNALAQAAIDRGTRQDSSCQAETQQFFKTTG